MPSKKLTAISIPHLGQGEWFDQGVAGLVLRVGKNRRAWQYRYRAGGSYRRQPLGHFPAMELGEAREAARKLIGRNLPKNRTLEMPSKKLTALSIPTLAPGEWYDAVLPGLILRVGKNRRTWQFRYHAGGSYRRVPLGHFPAMELKDAREAGGDLIMRVDSGAPPAPAEQHPRSSNTLTLGALLDRYEAMRMREGRRIKSLPKTQRALRRHLKPYLGLPADQFSKADLRAVRDTMVEARHRDRGQPPARRTRPDDALGGRGRFGPGQFRHRDPPLAARTSVIGC